MPTTTTRTHERTLRGRARAALAILVLGCGCSGADDAPNLVLITLDTTRADHLGCYGYARAETPNLDAFAASATRFARAATVANTTLPAHAAMLTGRHPQALNVPRNSFPLAEDHETLATRLSVAGYATAAFVSASALSSRLGLARGFDVYDDTFPVREMDQEQRRAEGTTRAAIAWLENATQDDDPYFLWVHYFDPHYPYTPPAPYDTLYGGDYEGPADGSMEHLLTIWGLGVPKVEPSDADVERLVDLYDGEIAYLDEWLGELVRAIDRASPARSTVVAVTADHGESLDEHGYFFNHGRYLYQPSVHVPLIVRFGDATRPSVVDAPVMNVDVFPTLLARAGIDPGPGAGVDLAPLASGEPAPDRALHTESARPWSVEQAFPGDYRNIGKAQAVIDWPHKLILTPFEGTVELYDLEKDPRELVNVAGQQPERADRLSNDVHEWRTHRVRSSIDPNRENLERLRSLGYID